MGERAVLVLLPDDPNAVRWLALAAEYCQREGFALSAVAPAADAVAMLAGGMVDVVVAVFPWCLPSAPDCVRCSAGGPTVHVVVPDSDRPRWIRDNNGRAVDRRRTELLDRQQRRPRLIR